MYASLEADISVFHHISDNAFHTGVFQGRYLSWLSVFAIHITDHQYSGIYIRSSDACGDLCKEVESN